MVEGERPRAHQAHLAPQNVPQLRQLVQAGAAQQAAHDRQHAGIVLQLEMLAPFFARARVAVQVLPQQGVRIDVHGAQLVNVDGRSALAFALLLVEGRPRIDALDQERGQRHERCGQQAQRRAQRQIERALESPVERQQQVLAQLEAQHAAQVTGRDPQAGHP